MQISVLLSVYINENPVFLKSALSSIFNQTLLANEVVIIKDGLLTDQLEEILNDFKNSYPKEFNIYGYKMNKGLGFALNFGLKKCSNELIFRMDADDIMHPERLERQVNYIDLNPELDLVATGIVSIDSENNIHGYRCVNSIVTNVDINTGFPIAHPTILARKSWYKRHYYTEDYPRSEDYDLWCRASASNDLKIAILPDKLLFYRELGAITASKLVNSYRDGLGVRLKYGTRNKHLETSRIFFKCLFVQSIFMVGIESYLIKKRNNYFTGSDSIRNYKKIINNIETSIKTKINRN